MSKMLFELLKAMKNWSIMTESIKQRLIKRPLNVRSFLAYEEQSKWMPKLQYASVTALISLP